MPAHKASPVQLSAEHERELNELVRAHSTPQKLANAHGSSCWPQPAWGAVRRLNNLGFGARRPVTGDAGGGTRGPRPAWRQRGSVFRRGVLRDSFPGRSDNHGAGPRCDAPGQTSATATPPSS